MSNLQALAFWLITRPSSPTLESYEQAWAAVFGYSINLQGPKCRCFHTTTPGYNNNFAGDQVGRCNQGLLHSVSHAVAVLLQGANKNLQAQKCLCQGGR